MSFHHGPYTLTGPTISTLNHLPGLNWILTPVSFWIFLIISPFLPITIPTANRGTGTLMPKDGSKMNKAVPFTKIVKLNFKYKHPHQGCLLQLVNHTRPSVPWSLDLWWDPSPSPWLAEDKRQYEFKTWGETIPRLIQKPQLQNMIRNFSLPQSFNSKAQRTVFHKNYFLCGTMCLHHKGRKNRKRTCLFEGARLPLLSEISIFSYIFIIVLKLSKNHFIQLPN